MILGIFIYLFSAIHFLGNQTVNSFVSVLIVLLWSSSRFYEARTRSVRLSPCQWVQFWALSLFSHNSFLQKLVDFGSFLWHAMRRLCVIGLAPSHVALTEKGGVTAVDFNVGKTDRSGIKVTGKRKKVIAILPEWESIIDFNNNNDNTVSELPSSSLL